MTPAQFGTVRSNKQNSEQRPFRCELLILFSTSHTPRFGVRGGRGWVRTMPRPWVPISLYLTAFLKLFSLLQKRFRPSVRPSDHDTMTNTGLEVTASPSGSNINFLFQ